MMRLKKIAVLFLISILLTGCWDKIEINRRSLISIIGVDAGEQIAKEKDLKKLSPDEPYTGMDLKKIHVTFGAPDISKLGPGIGTTAEDIYIDTDAYSMEDAVSKASLKSSRDLKFGNIKLLVLSKGLMEHPNVVKEVIDYLQREPSLNRMMYVILSDGKAENFIKFKPGMEKNIESYLDGIIENPTTNAAILPVTLNEFLRLLGENGNAILPNLVMEGDKKDIKISGVAMIKNYKLKGTLSPIETSNLEMLRGRLKGGRKVIYRNGHPIDITIDSGNRKITMSNYGGKIHLNIKVNIAGQIRDYYVGDSVFSRDILKNLQDNLNKATEQECEEIIKITQQEFSIDPIGFREYIEKFHPSTWNSIKDKWQDVYKNAVINVEVNSNIRRIGVAK